MEGTAGEKQTKALETIQNDLTIKSTEDGVERTYVPDAAFLKQSLGTEGYANLVGAGKAFENDAALDAAINAKLNPPTNP